MIAKTKRLLASILICNFAGIIGPLLTDPQASDWYAVLEKPWFQPPNWVYAPLWLTLYTLMGIALYFVWQNKDKASYFKPTIYLFFLQLLVAGTWAFVFFHQLDLNLAATNIALVWIILIFVMMAFYRFSKLASMLLIPYFLWTTYAVVLNISLIVLN